MKILRYVLICSVFVLVAACSHQQKNVQYSQSSDTGHTQHAQQMDMAQVEKLASPGENHRYLEPIVGKWNHTVRFRMTPDAKMEESKGTSSNKWIMDKRFVQADVTGKAMGKNFQGLGITGYDNVKKQYNTVWIDNMGTGIMTANAQYDPETKIFTENGEFSCPMTGEQQKHYRGVTKITGPNTYVYEMYMQGPNGQEYKAMEINYVRANTSVSQR